MANFDLPQFFKTRINKSTYKSNIVTALETSAEYYRDETRGLPLFPEYTGHRFDHVQGVLIAASWLVDDASRKYVMPEDVAFLVASILLHDAAMLMTEEGFLTLLKDGTGPAIPALDAVEWRPIWESFYSAAKRWDEQKLAKVFSSPLAPGSGDSTDFSTFLSFKDFGDPETWNQGNRRLVGEFVRIHHARLAHEFALNGVPGKSTHTRLRLVEGDEEFLDLCGFIARSHNLPLRSTFGYLTKRFSGKVSVLESRPLFAMVVLRIADFLQVDASRAPRSSLKLRSLRNPISRTEWAAHLAVREVREDETDNQAVFIRCSPRDSHEYLRLRRLLSDLQEELDGSWAVLGEVLSRQERWRNLGIRLRRVNSNLDDAAAFATEVNFIPQAFEFTTASGKLLTRLVTPLYGDRPEVGIRELLQNAIDAVNELQLISQPTKDAAEPTISVRLKKNDSNYVVEVEDFGVGMDADIVASYFLRAGATFRDSDAWRRDYCDQAGAPRVLRSGRFGVGVLAAFLLGDSIKVVTRHYLQSENGALEFTARVNDEQIDIRKSTRDRPGTTISVQISKQTYDSLAANDGVEWDWYRWQQPRVDRSIDGKPVPHQLTRVPLPGANLSDEWHRLDGTDFEDVCWTYGRAPHVVCNGLNVGSLGSSRGYRKRFHWEGSKAKSSDASIPIAVPSVVVTDSKGQFPLNLQRYEVISDRFPFSDALIQAATSDFVAFSLEAALPCMPDLGSIHQLRHRIRYPGLETNRIYSFEVFADWLFTTNGMVPLHWGNIRHFRPSRLIVILTLDYRDYGPSVQLGENEAICIGTVGHTPSLAHQLPMALVHLVGRRPGSLGPHMGFYTKNSGCRLLMPEALATIDETCVGTQFDLSGVSHHDVTLSAAATTNADVKLHVWEVGDNMPPMDSAWSSKLSPAIDGVLQGRWIVAEIYQPVLERHRDTVFTRQWEELMTEPVIPYDLAKRKQLFAKTYERLAANVSKWQRLLAMPNSGWLSRFHRNTHSNEPL